MTKIKNTVDLYQCPSCSKYHEVHKINPNMLDVGFKYYTCTCTNQVQINPYKIVTLDASMLDVTFITNLVPCTYVNNTNVVINLDNITLTKITPEESNVTNYLPYMESIYDMGDNYSVEDILYIHNLIEFENLRNTYDLYEIKHNDIHLGYIGGEVFLKDLSSTWLSWTIIIPEMRNRKIGAKALEIFSGILKTQGIEKLYVDSDYREDTIRFYERLGFTKLGTCKEFRTKINKKYNKQFLLYDEDVVMFIDL